MFRRPLAFLALTLAIFALYWAARIGYADYLALDHSPQTTAAAIRLTPANADYYAQLAEFDPTHSRAPIQQALALNPLNAGFYLRFAGIAEQQHDPTLAHAYLLRAVQLDRTFAPRWLLAEFYARAHDQSHFWPAMRAALATSYDDISPLFDLCWQLTPDPATIFPRAIPATTRPDVTRQYLDYLLSKNHTALAGPVAASLLQHPGPQSTPPLLTYADQSLAAANPAPALRVWNTLAQLHRIDYPALQPAKGISVTDPDFSRPFLAQAFDWRIVKPPQIFAAHPDSVRFDFSGKQPEQCNLIEQYVPLVPSRTYQLSVRYYTRGLTANPPTSTGLRWQLANSVPLPLQPDTPLPASESALVARYTFSTSPQSDLANLQLTYHRDPGTVRIEGSLYLLSVNLGFAP